jgi:hypothetical protein
MPTIHDVDTRHVDEPGETTATGETTTTGGTTTT